MTVGFIFVLVVVLAIVGLILYFRIPIHTGIVELMVEL